jgi:hypothetical protein
MMADWFESRFREPVDPGSLDPTFTAKVRALVVEEWEAGPTPVTTPRTGSHTMSSPFHGGAPDDGEGDLIVIETGQPSTDDESTVLVRRTRSLWLLVAAAAAVVAILVGLAPTDDHDPELDPSAPAATPTTSTPDAATPKDVLDQPEGARLEPGTYVIDPDGDDATPLRVTFEVADEDWEPWIGAFKRSDAGHVVLSITTIDNVVREGCLDHTPLEPAVGPAVDDLADALSRLAPFEVSAPPSDVTALGYTGKHLQLTVPDLPVTGTGDDRLFSECSGDHLNSWFAPNLGSRAFYGYNGEAGRTEDFWILDVDGTRLVIVVTSSQEAPKEDLAELDAIYDSIRIET